MNMKDCLAAQLSAATPQSRHPAEHLKLCICIHTHTTGRTQKHGGGNHQESLGHFLKVWQVVIRFVCSALVCAVDHLWLVSVAEKGSAEGNPRAGEGEA